MTDKTIERNLKDLKHAIGDRVEIGITKGGKLWNGYSGKRTATVKGTIIGYCPNYCEPIVHIDDADYTSKLGCIDLQSNVNYRSLTPQVHSSYKHLSKTGKQYARVEIGTYRQIDSNGKPIPKTGKYDLKVGDRVEVGFKKDRYVIKGNSAKWHSSIKGTVVGFNYFDDPIVYFDEEAQLDDNYDPLQYLESANSDDIIDWDYKGITSTTDERFITIKNKNAFKLLDDISKESREKFGVEIGQKIWVYQQESGVLCESKEKHSDKTIAATVVGCNGSSITVAFDEDAVKGLHSTLHGALAGYIHPSLESKYNPSKSNYWYVYDKAAFETVAPKTIKEEDSEDEDKVSENTTNINNKKDTVKERNGNHMENNLKQEFWTEMKSNAIDASYRVGAHQTAKAVKAGLISLMEKQGHGSDKIKALTEMLDSTVGQAIISSILGHVLGYVPKIGEDPRVARLSKELRINGISDMGNFVMDGLVEHLVPVVMGAIANIPQEGAQVRIGEKANETTEEQEQEQVAEKKTLTA